jgi:TetR/AcrR family transcriptional regulator, cholesterol catabolism regulator
LKERRADRPRQQAHAARTRERGPGTDEEIVRAATKLFRDRGYYGTSMSDVAGVVGVTAASLYYHFENKQELLLSVLRTGMDTFLESLEEIAATDAPPEVKLHRAIANHLAFVLQRGDAVAVFLRERRFLEPPHVEQYQPRVDRYDELFRTILSEAVDGRKLPRKDPKLLSMVVLGTINSVVEWYRPEGRYDEHEIAAFLGELIDGMLRAPA